MRYHHKSFLLYAKVEIKRCNKDADEEVVPLQGSTLIDDLRTELAGLRFSDFTLVNFIAHDWVKNE